MRQMLARYQHAGLVFARKKLAGLLVPMVQPLRSGMGCIVMLHRVLPATKCPVQRYGMARDIEHSVEHVERVVRWFLRNGYEPINIDKVEARLKRNNGRRFVVFTVDDGFVDGYQHIRPLFAKYDVPWTFYISTAYIDRSIILEAHLLEQRMQAGAFPITLEMPDGSVITCHGNHLQECDDFIESVARLGRMMDVTAFRKWAWDQLGRQDLEDLADQLCCNWDQIREMSRDPDIIIGAHTVSHVPLARVSDEDLQHELQASRKMLETQLGLPVVHFAYPMGSVTVKASQAAKVAGYSTAVTTTISNLFEENLQNVQALPRLHWKPDDEETFRLSVSGADAFIYFRGKRFDMKKSVPIK